MERKSGTGTPETWSYNVQKEPPSSGRTFTSRPSTGRTPTSRPSTGRTPTSRPSTAGPSMKRSSVSRKSTSRGIRTAPPPYCNLMEKYPEYFRNKPGSDFYLKMDATSHCRCFLSTAVRGTCTLY